MPCDKNENEEVLTADMELDHYPFVLQKRQKNHDHHPKIEKVTVFTYPPWAENLNKKIETTTNVTCESTRQR